MFSAAVRNQATFTTNGMPALKSSGSAVADLFYEIGAMRGKDPVPAFAAAFGENKDHALRIALWARDVRGGAGERKIFRDILLWLEIYNPTAAALLALKVPELGRWDDLLVFTTPPLKRIAYATIRKALSDGNGLCAKWMPRKGAIAEELRTYIGLNHRSYRKLLVELTKVVETQMCAQKWDEINFSHVPSVAASRYRKAFYRHTENFAKYVERLKNGDAEVKVNAGALYPHDLTSKLRVVENSTESDHIQAQWDALPNYVGDASILAMVDVSGSMSCPVGKSKTVYCIDVAVGLGLYLADKNKGAFKDTFLTFASYPQLLHLQGNLAEKYAQMNQSSWGMSTNLDKAMDVILETAVTHRVPREEMPEMLLILSDMQFDGNVKVGPEMGMQYTRDVKTQSAMAMIASKYAAAGYTVPKVVFWNLNAEAGNMPVSLSHTGTALISGFSPAILKSVLANDLDSFSPESIMLHTIMDERYNYQ